MRWSSESGCRLTVKDNQLVSLDFKANLNGLTAHLAIFDVRLSALFREIEKHGNALMAVRASEFSFNFQFHAFELRFSINSGTQNVPSWASKVIDALNNLETGQPAFALSASSANRV